MAADLQARLLPRPEDADAPEAAQRLRLQRCRRRWAASRRSNIRSPFGHPTTSSAADLEALLLPREGADAQPQAGAAAAEAQATAGGGVAGDGTQATKTHTRGHKASLHASLRAGAMLAQICESSLIEHQLAARNFKFLNFCEQPCPPVAPWPL